MSTIVTHDNLMYLHIPKTAGVSVSKWIRRSINDNYYKIYFDHPLLNSVYDDIGRDKKYFVFTTVRNPWARVVSGYQNFLRHYHGNRQLMLKDAVDEIIKMNGDLPDLNKWIELLPHTEALVGENWNMRTTQMEWIHPGVDLIIKIENLEKEFEPIFEIFKSREPIEVYNKSDLDLDYRLVLTDNSKNIISKLFEADIDTLKYTF